MFKDLDEGQTQFCPFCLEKQKEIEQLINQNNILKTELNQLKLLYEGQNMLLDDLRKRIRAIKHAS